MVVGDILDYDKVYENLRDADYVYHFAGIADIDEAADRPLDTLKYNVLGTATILDACIKAKVKRFIFASTIYVYSNTGSFYRVSKQTSELLTEAYNEKYGLEYTILRFGSLYGPRSDMRNGIFRLVYQAIKDGKITYYGSGEETREYIHVYEAAKLCVKILSPEYANRIVTLTGHRVMKSREVIEMIREMLGGKIEVEFKPRKSNVHYVMTPYSFNPKLGIKLVSEEFVDMGQGLLQLMEEIFKETHSEYKEDMGVLLK
jgi:UDP-glucose 4-epimerase